MTQYLSAEVILVMHSEVVDATGGSHGVRDPHLLAAIAEKPRAAFDGSDLYQGIFKKASVYLEAIVNYHVFVDGNKRTGITACARFLFANGYELHATNRAVELLVLSIATKKRNIEAIAVWLAEHTKKIQVKKVSVMKKVPTKRKRVVPTVRNAEAPSKRKVVQTTKRTRAAKLCAPNKKR